RSRPRSAAARGSWSASLVTLPRPPKPEIAMSKPKLTLAQWRTAIEGATTEIALNAFSFPGAVVGDPVGHEAAAAMIGAHIPVLGSVGAFDLALVATRESCQALSRAILY